MEDKELTDEQVDVAVKWWTNDLKDPTFQQVESGQEDARAIVTKGLAHYARGRGPKEEKIRKFSRALRKKLKESNGQSLSTDYNPGTILSEALEEADIEDRTFNLSIKTFMRFDLDGVQVSHGYRAPLEELILKNPPRLFCKECGHLISVHKYDYTKEDSIIGGQSCVLCKCHIEDAGMDSVNKRVPTDEEESQYHRISDILASEAYKPEYEAMDIDQLRRHIYSKLREDRDE